MMVSLYSSHGLYKIRPDRVDASVTTQMKVHSDPAFTFRSRLIAVLNTSSPQTFPPTRGFM